MSHPLFPPRQGLYDPSLEKDSCGVGFIVDIHGKKSHNLVRQGLEILVNLDHRGARGSDPDEGDGAGILMQIPHEFLAAQAAKLKIALPSPGSYGAGMMFFPLDPQERAQAQALVDQALKGENLTVLGWRDVPTDPASLGKAAQDSRPFVRQVFIDRPAGLDETAFERRLYTARRAMEKSVWAQGLHHFSVPSFSCATMVYKGMLTPQQVEKFYPDLTDETMTTAISLVHARYSTNTFPSWELAHPFRMMAHNGEINTLRGNINWMGSREKNLSSPLFGGGLDKVVPVINARGSDSSMFDNVLEFLVMTGRKLPHAMMMMIPEAWDNNDHMDEDRKAFYAYHANLMEPWDGPAAIAFSDGRMVGATLDRNGLRPARITITKDGLVIMASEAGVLDIPPANVERKTRLRPGRIFVVDTTLGRVIEDEEMKAQVVAQHPYREWIAKNIIHLDDLPQPPHVHQPDHSTVLRRQQAFGYTKEDLKIILASMAEKGEEPIGSMGADIPLAVLSNRPRLLFDYFKQNFAQVTNPPIDPIREAMVMSLVAFVGKEGNLMDEAPRNAHVLNIPHPILTNYDLERLRHVTVGDFQAKTLSMLFRAEDGPKGLGQALERLNREADAAVRAGYSLIILTDRGMSSQLAPIPSLLATASVHHHLIREGTRNNVGLILETGEAREGHHFALLLGYGATAVNPYLAFETLVDEFTPLKDSPDADTPPAVKNYIKAVKKSLLKIFSKMGISTLQSYHGAQIFEVLGLKRELVDTCFTGTHTRIEGVGLEEIAQETLRRHRMAYAEDEGHNFVLDVGGVYKWRREGEFHQINPAMIHALQKAVRENDWETYQRYAELVNDQSEKMATLRGLFRFKPGTPIPLEQVEPASEIMKRFATGAMSLGSISREAHENLAIAMNRIGGRSNSGEGGEDPTRFAPMPNGDSRNSAIKQVASGRFGVNSHYLVNAKEIQIKIAQGAKPGEGGQLPGHKVDSYIGSIRFTTPGVGLISPPPHHDIYSIEDLKQLIFDLKNANPEAIISVKLVSETGVGTVAAGVAKAKADKVLISGHDGGTGASPLSSIQFAGAPWELGLAETHQTLVMNNLRGRIRVQTDGQLKTGRDVAVAALLGAEEFGFSTTALITQGCIMMRVCHLNTCPVGVATQDKRLRKKFTGQPEHLVNFFTFIAEDVRRWMAQLGFRTMDEMIGRADLLEYKRAETHWKAHGLDLTPLLYRPPVGPEVRVRKSEEQDHGIAGVLDHTLIERAKDALEHGKPVKMDLPIRNLNLSTGTMLGSRVSRKYGANGLPDGTIQINFQGTAGQSFGAFLPQGITLTLQGEANDYVGKGLSGGRVIVRPPEGATLVPENNMIVGNVVLYGATRGEAFFNGLGGERFCVRNSGATTVVEGVGDHGCEYMTGGRVVVLGPTGLNFAAGMSGGIAYVLDEDGKFHTRCNTEMVALEPLEADDKTFLQDLLERHVALTHSPKAKRLLAHWEAALAKIVKVMPVEYKRVMQWDGKVRQEKEIA
ncbi:MAG: glutamate synthase large subunit [Deltaproteobacteria bacterium]|nr:glutamate synthase large subunit [Deltaproteobacteria bacterium]MDH4122071.1 glutamate synthase large subunit [Deltaproteobacteria bacterium]